MKQTPMMLRPPRRGQERDVKEYDVHALTTLPRREQCLSNTDPARAVLKKASGCGVIFPGAASPATAQSFVLVNPERFGPNCGHWLRVQGLIRPAGIQKSHSIPDLKTRGKSIGCRSEQVDPRGQAPPKACGRADTWEGGSRHTKTLLNCFVVEGFDCRVR
jgi:hypothetical protein